MRVPGRDDHPQLQRQALGELAADPERAAGTTGTVKTNNHVAAIGIVGVRDQGASCSIAVATLPSPPRWRA